MPRKKGKSVSTTTAPKNGNGKPERGAKTAAIKKLYAEGTTQASDIHAALESQGLSVSKPVIYQTINKLKSGNGKKKGGRKPGRKAAATAAVTPAARPAPARGLLAADIHELLAITERAGGVDVIVGLLENMKRAQ